MPHLKCVACRARLFSASGGGRAVEPCPRCGRPLEPVGALAEIVGFQAIARPGAAQSLVDDGGISAPLAVPLARPLTEL